MGGNDFFYLFRRPELFGVFYSEKKKLGRA
jgi:hypothetical protein